jgi:hypothetical protein
VLADVLDHEPEPRGFDLVAVLYLQVPRPEPRRVVRSAADAARLAARCSSSVTTRRTSRRDTAGRKTPLSPTGRGCRPALGDLVVERAEAVERTVALDPGEASPSTPSSGHTAPPEPEELRSPPSPERRHRTATAGAEGPRAVGRLAPADTNDSTSAVGGGITEQGLRWHTSTARAMTTRLTRDVDRSAGVVDSWSRRAFRTASPSALAGDSRYDLHCLIELRGARMPRPLAARTLARSRASEVE